MNLLSIRLITANFDQLVRFYERITGISATRFTEDFGELTTPAGTLAIGSVRTLQLFGREHVAQAAANRSAIIEFRVDDVDAAFARIEHAMGSDIIVQPPTTMPWGNRSLLLRDPDGNLVNFFQPVTEAALQKFGPMSHSKRQ